QRERDRPPPRRSTAPPARAGRRRRPRPGPLRRRAAEARDPAEAALPRTARRPPAPSRLAAISPAGRPDQPHLIPRRTGIAVLCGRSPPPRAVDQAETHSSAMIGALRSCPGSRPLRPNGPPGLSEILTVPSSGPTVPQVTAPMEAAVLGRLHYVVDGEVA